MAGTTVRISSQSSKILKEIAREKGVSLQNVLDEAIEEHRRTIILREANEAYAALKNDPSLWKDEKDERDLWELTLTDGQEESY